MVQVCSLGRNPVVRRRQANRIQALPHLAVSRERSAALRHRLTDHSQTHEASHLVEDHVAGTSPGAAPPRGTSPGQHLPGAPPRAPPSASPTSPDPPPQFLAPSPGVCYSVSQ